MWSQRAILIYPIDDLTEQQKDSAAQAYVTHGGLETLANERLMFDKATHVSGDYGATETHRQISTAATPELAAALTEALTGISGTWYLLDADTDALLATNDMAKQGRDSIDWEPGVDVTAGEILRYKGALYEVVKSHLTQSDYPCDVAKGLFKRYRAPGEVGKWVKPVEASTTYPIGARVTFNGETWINTIPANMLAPDVAGWTKQTA